MQSSQSTTSTQGASVVKPPRTNNSRHNTVDMIRRLSKIRPESKSNNDSRQHNIDRTMYNIINLNPSIQTDLVKQQLELFHHYQSTDNGFGQDNMNYINPYHYTDTTDYGSIIYNQQQLLSNYQKPSEHQPGYWDNSNSNSGFGANTVLGNSQHLNQDVIAILKDDDDFTPANTITRDFDNDGDSDTDYYGDDHHDILQLNDYSYYRSPLKRKTLSFTIYKDHSNSAIDDAKDSNSSQQRIESKVEENDNIFHKLDNNRHRIFSSLYTDHVHSHDTDSKYLRISMSNTITDFPTLQQRWQCARLLIKNYTKSIVIMVNLPDMQSLYLTTHEQRSCWQQSISALSALFTRDRKKSAALTENSSEISSRREVEVTATNKHQLETLKKTFVVNIHATGNFLSEQSTGLKKRTSWTKLDFQKRVRVTGLLATLNAKHLHYEYNADTGKLIVIIMKPQLHETSEQQQQQQQQSYLSLQRPANNVTQIVKEHHVVYDSLHAITRSESFT